MKKRTKRIAIILAVVGGLLAFAFNNTASAAEVNFGSCLAGLDDRALAPYQAPGQTGNGPLVVVNGTPNVPNAFAGGMGCTR